MLRRGDLHIVAHHCQLTGERYPRCYAECVITHAVNNYATVLEFGGATHDGYGNHHCLASLHELGGATYYGYGNFTFDIIIPSKWKVLMMTSNQR